MTVSHTATSNSDAHRVKMSGGNRHQQIFWTERGPDEGPKPWDSELTVTDDVFWTWSQNVLGRSMKELSFIYNRDAHVHHIYHSFVKLNLFRRKMQSITIALDV